MEAHVWCCTSLPYIIRINKTVSDKATSHTPILSAFLFYIFLVVRKVFMVTTSRATRVHPSTFPEWICDVADVESTAAPPQLWWLLPRPLDLPLWCTWRHHSPPPPPDWCRSPPQQEEWSHLWKGASLMSALEEYFTTRMKPGTGDAKVKEKIDTSNKIRMKRPTQ